jgi:hypothetical protein
MFSPHWERISRVRCFEALWLRRAWSHVYSPVYWFMRALVLERSRFGRIGWEEVLASFPYAWKTYCWPVCNKEGKGQRIWRYHS